MARTHIDVSVYFYMPDRYNTDMNHNDFFKILNNGMLNGAYFLHGDEEFVKDSAVRAACEIIPVDMRAFNLTILDNADVERVIECCETLPVFTEKSIVILRELPSAADTPKLIEYLDNMSDTTILLIVKKGRADERSALLKFFTKKNRIRRLIIVNAMFTILMFNTFFPFAYYNLIMRKESCHRLISVS